MQTEAMSIEGEIIANGAVAADHYLMSVELPRSFPVPSPGQFVMVRAAGRQEPLLSRPLGVYGFHRNPNYAVLDLLYRVCGKGTGVLSRLTHRDRLQILGPLGRGFDVAPEKKHIILIAGGVGIVPITYLAYHYGMLGRLHHEKATASGRNIVGYLGAKCCDNLIGQERLAMYCSEVKISTDDGSLGCCGLVTDMLSADLDSFSARDTAIYACGPAAMMRTVAEILESRAIPCQVSVEERMACGIGACLGCAVRVNVPGGGYAYRRVCKEGPVFDIREIVWEDGGEKCALPAGQSETEEGGDR
jgi:dihydroorotate dehydrogenase electron transfer subunit